MIFVFTINKPSRPERKQHVLSQFSDKREYKVQVVSAIPHKVGSISLWQTIQHIIREKVDQREEYFIFCEDDHLFTENYSFEYLDTMILQAKALNADILSGGVSWFQTGVQLSQNLFWIERFSGLQFTVIFRQFYQKILDVKDFGEQDTADYKISDLTDKKFVMYPFISVQKEFGYSDVTAKNNESGRVEKLFQETSEKLQLLQNIRNFYLPDFKY